MDAHGEYKFRTEKPDYSKGKLLLLEATVLTTAPLYRPSG